MNIEECLAHIPNRLTPDMKIFAHDVVFKDNHYIFTERNGKRLDCYCTYCRSEFEIDKLRHNELHYCPHCRVACTVKSGWRGRKYLINEAYFVYYLKSAVDPQAIVAIGTRAVRDFTGDYRTVETLFAEIDLFVFQHGKPGQAFHRYNYYSMAKTMQTYEWTKAVAAKCQFNRDRNNNIHCACSLASVKVAVAGTPFQYSTWEKYNYDSMVGFFDLASRYQCVEYLTKLGFSWLVKDKLNGEKTYRAINWRGKNPIEVLGLTKQEIHDVRINGINLDFLDLKILKASKADGSNFTPAEAEKFGIDGLRDHVDGYLKLKRYGTLRQIYNYLTKQVAKGKIKNCYQCFIFWRDYLNDCVELGMDLSRETIVFPRNLHRAHQRTIKLVKHKEDELLDRKIKVRAESLQSLEHNGLIIRPACSTGEIIAEGVYLKHCIGGYCAGYANGQYDLYFIRKAEEPEDPYYSAEVRDGKLIQCYGYEHVKATSEVQEFLDLFIEVAYKKQSRKEAAN